MNTANKLTLLRIILVPVLILCLCLHLSNFIATAIFIIAAVTDIFDGRWARKHGLCSDFGRLMDPIADKLLVCSALMMLIGQKDFPAVFAIVFIGREFIISGFRQVAAGKGTVIAAALSGKLKTTFQCIMIPLWLLKDEAIFNFAPLMSTIYTVVLWVVTFAALYLSIHSCVEYIYKNRKAVSFK